jgi:hypothetical protein
MKMGYTTVSKIRSVIDTDKSDKEVMDIIDNADAYIDMLLNGTSASTKLLSSWSSRLVAYNIVSMGNTSGITGSSTSNISRIKIGDAEIQKEAGSNIGSSTSGGKPTDWRSQVESEIKTHIRMCKRG